MPLEPLVAKDVAQRGSQYLRVVGRLKPGVTVREADAELKPSYTASERTIPASTASWSDCWAGRRCSPVTFQHGEPCGSIRWRRCDTNSGGRAAWSSVAP